MQDSHNSLQPETQTGVSGALLVFSILSLPLLYFPITLIWDSSTALSISCLLGILVVVPIFLSRYPKGAFYTLLCYLPFAGTVIYALGGNPSLSLIKDAFYLAALIGVIKFCRQEKQPILLPQAIRAPLGLVFSVSILTIAFTNLPDQIQGIDGALPLVMGIWGLKVLLGYVPLIACTYYLIRTEKDFYFLMRLQVVLILIACTLGTIQFLLLQTGICAGTQGQGEELFRASLNARCFVGGSLLYSPEVGITKLPGTFVAPWQWGWFLLSGIFFSFCTAFRDETRLWRMLGSVAIVAITVSLIISDQRLMLILLLPSALFLMAMAGHIKDLKRFIPISLLLAGLLLYLIFRDPTILANNTGDLISQQPFFQPHAFLQEQFSQVWQTQEGFFGHGVGRATNSARAYGKTVLIETYHPKLLYELGPWGLISVLVMYGTVIFSTFKAYRSTQNPRLKAYAAAMWAFVLLIGLFPYYYPLDVEPVNVYFWVAAGLTLKLPQLAKPSGLGK
ncbi:MAG: hypothetical protein AAFQ95_18130 [Cyanobacteria bacterium J06621_3]